MIQYPTKSDISTTWSKNSDKNSNSTKKPRLDINALSKIEVTANLDQLHSSKEIENFVQTASVLGTFLLMVGKRSDGRRVLLDLVKLIISLEIDDVEGMDFIRSSISSFLEYFSRDRLYAAQI